MKTTILFCGVLLFFAVLSAQAQQWSGTGPIYTTSSTTNVGIGTSTPANAFEIVRPAAFALSLNRTGNTSSQKSELGFFKNGNVKWTLGTDMFDNGTNSFYIWNSTIGAPFFINASGNIGIGTTCIPATYKLAVDGKVICEELLVKISDNNGCWPDYVFSETFKLKPIQEVEKYILDHQHLPEVPSASELEENGVSTSEMFKIQMKKIEELTLYMIELNKTNQLLKTRVEELEKSITK